MFPMIGEVESFMDDISPPADEISSKPADSESHHKEGSSARDAIGVIS